MVAQLQETDVAGAARDYERVEAAIRYIDQHAREQPSLAEMAAALNLSEHHFHRLFRRWAGITPKRFLQLLTLEHAKRRLEESRNVLEASFRTGLSGPSRLHDLFVTLEGMTPGEHQAEGHGIEVRWGLAATPFGDAFIAATERGVCHLSFLDPERDLYTEAEPDTAPSAAAEAESREVGERWPGARLIRDDAAMAEVAGRMFEGAEIPLHVRGTNFQVQVWQALLRVPRGALVSYGELAERVGRPSAARAVAGAVAGNRIGWLIPCHRVIRSVGESGGYRWGPMRKRAMLAWEAAGDPSEGADVE